LTGKLIFVAPFSNLIIDHPYVSRQHFEIYSVIYDEETPFTSGQSPMLYVRDCQSLEGTLVSKCLIGSKKHGHTPGYLLQHGDVIAIRPYWSFRVKMKSATVHKHIFSQLQVREMFVSR